jgi:hypothetical protein
MIHFCTVERLARLNAAAFQKLCVLLPLEKSLSRRSVTRAGFYISVVDSSRRNVLKEG